MNCAFLAVLLSISVAAAAFAAASLTPLGDLPGGPFRSSASGVSGDGSVVVGVSDYSASSYQAFRWTNAGGMVGLGDLPGSGSFSLAYDVSGDGSVIVGYGVSASGQEAFRWTSEGGMVGLGYPPDQPLLVPFSSATGVSSDGSVVVGVGQADSEHYAAEAFLWTNGYMADLDFLPPPFFAGAAHGVSDDGSVVVGGMESAEGFEAFRWTSEGGIVALDGHPFVGASGANDVNADGSVVVGFSNSATGTQAFRWTSDGGLVELGILPGHVYSEAQGVSGDGSVVVGISDSDDNFGYGEAFRWTSDGGMERLWDVIVDHGVDPAADGWTSLADAAAISADGRTIVGTGVRNGNAEAFAAFIPIAPELPGDFNFDGNVDAADYTVWRDGLGPKYSMEDYDDWKANFGQSLGAGSSAAPAVPEPTSLALMTLATSALVVRGRRHTVCARPTTSSHRTADQIKGRIR